MIEPPDAYGPCMSRTTRLPASSRATPAHTRPRAGRGAASEGHSAKTTTAPPSASASPRNAIPRAKASIVRTIAFDEPSGVEEDLAGAPMLNVNAPDTGCESVETTRQATT